MDVQGYIPVKEDNGGHHYKDSERINLTSCPDYKVTSSIPTILPVLVEEEYNTLTGDTAIAASVQNEEYASSSQEQESEPDRLNPALLLNRYDKRKSSPAILGLPFGLNHEAQLSLHLSQQRNSIEAAMLLANFNRLMAFPKANEVEHKAHPQQQHWQDDMSIPSKNQNSWGDVLESEAENNRRHSYDVNMSWQTMPEAFLERPDLLHNLVSSPDNGGTSVSSSENNSGPSSAPVFKQENFYTNTPTKVTWSHDDMHQQHHHPHSQQHSHQQQHHPYSTVEYSNHPISPRQQNRLYHPTMSSPLAPHTYQHRYPPHPQQQDHHQHTAAPMLHPLARQPDGKDPLQQQQPQHQYYSYTFPPQHPMQPPPQNQRYFYPNSGKLPIPANQAHDPNNSQTHAQQSPHLLHHPPLLAKPRRKKQKSNNPDEYEEELGLETNEEDYPDMAQRDVEAARTDPEARPRKQKLRFTCDKYTPQWVRYNGQSKEGLCDTCKPGKWLQLKNSAYWYHKQFFHGISSVSGKEFVQPVETRWVDQDLVEGLCHQCHQWVAVSNVKRKNSVLWYRHAHKCHVYHKPKPNAPKKR